MPEIVYGDQGGWLHALDPATGTDIAPFPVNVGSAIDSSPAVADLDNDGANEIVVGLGSTWVPNQQGGVRIYNGNGSLRCIYNTGDKFNIWTGGPPDGRPDGVVSSPSVGDIDGDGRMDAVFGGFDHHIHAIDRQCRSLSGFPFHVEDTTWSSPALYDSDDDGRLEIFIGSDQTPGGLAQFNWAGGEFRALDHRNGQVVELWKRRSHDVFSSSAAIGDINADGRMEVVTGGGDFYHHVDGWKVWAFDLQTGSDVAGWPRITGGAVSSSPAIGDLNGDGRDDVVVGSRDASVYAWHGDGALLWRRGPIPNCCVPPRAVNGSPIIADLDGDGDQDVAVGTDVATNLLDGRTGQPIGGAPEFGFSFENAAAVGDFGPHGRLLIVGGFVTASGNTPPTHRVAAYQLSGSAASEWPMFQRDARRLGAPVSGGDPLPPGYCVRPSNPKPAPSAASGDGYWVLGRDGGVFTFGAAQYEGSLPARGVTTPAAAMVGRRDGTGYWIVDERGLVHAFDTPYLGDMRYVPLNAPIISMAPTPSGNGYWLLAADGGIFTFGDARFHGSTGGLRLNAPIISMASTASGNGYWLLAADGGVFTFGDASFHGSTGNLRLNAPVISMAVHPGGAGYWLLARDGGVFTFGGAGFHGSLPGTGLCGLGQGVQIRPTATGSGYWLLAADGGIFTFGDAVSFGAQPGLYGSRAAVDLAIVG